MAGFGAGSVEQVTFLDDLVDGGLLGRTGVDGIYARGEKFERVRRAFDALITRSAAPESPELLYVSPLLARRELERNGYLGTFPHLAGTVFAFEGDEHAAALQFERASSHEDWSEYQRMSDIVLTPAACYPVYPAIAARGALALGGATVDTGDAYVFRREPSSDPARMQIFHMRELVRIAEATTIVRWRAHWRARAEQLLRSLGLQVEIEVASDPFFGRSGELLAERQRDQELKWELLAPVTGERPTAIASSNYHHGHFGQIYGLTVGDEVAHTACMAFGEERVTLGLFSAHGFDLAKWPADVSARLGL